MNFEEFSLLQQKKYEQLNSKQEQFQNLYSPCLNAEEISTYNFESDSLFGIDDISLSFKMHTPLTPQKRNQHQEPNQDIYTFKNLHLYEERESKFNLSDSIDLAEQKIIPQRVYTQQSLSDFEFDGQAIDQQIDEMQINIDNLKRQIESYEENIQCLQGLQNSPSSTSFISNSNQNEDIEKDSKLSSFNKIQDKGIQKQQRKRKPKKAVFFCNLKNCEFGTHTKILLERHQKKEHNYLGISGDYKCSQCSAEFHIQLALNRHIKIQHEQKRRGIIVAVNLIKTCYQN